VTTAAGRLLAGAAASLVLAFAALAADVTEPIPVPKLTGRVVDLTGTLTSGERDAIAGRLRDFESKKGSQIAVLLVPSIGPEAIEEFATRVTDAWKLGRAGVDDGVLLVIAKQERKIRIQTGRGVQGVLTDALSKRIIVERITPRFRAGDFAGGISAGLEAVMGAIEGESLPPPASKPPGRQVAQGYSIENFFWLAFVVVPIVGMVLRSLVGRLLGAGLTSAVTGLAAWLLFGSVILGVLGAVVALLLVLFMGVPAGGFGRGGPGGWSSGGSFGGGGGGFSGGGGGFDGGGASGNW
jgi:uncharacterized protein